MQKILRMLVRLRRLRTKFQRESAFTDPKHLSYTVMIVDYHNKSTHEKVFDDLKEACSYVYPMCKTAYGKEFFVYTHTSKGKRFLKFNPVTP